MLAFVFLCICIIFKLLDLSTIDGGVVGFGGLIMEVLVGSGALLCAVF